MNIGDYSLHDSIILNVTEFPGTQTLELLIDYPLDWGNNIFEHHLLRFNDVISYIVEEIPFEGAPTILDIEDKGISPREFGFNENSISAERNRIEIITNAGKRIVDYKTCELIKTTNL